MVYIFFQKSPISSRFFFLNRLYFPTLHYNSKPPISKPCDRIFSPCDWKHYSADWKVESVATSPPPNRTALWSLFTATLHTVLQWYSVENGRSVKLWSKFSGEKLRIYIGQKARFSAKKPSHGRLILPTPYLFWEYPIALNRISFSRFSLSLLIFV